jgi:hypothetical protein
MKKLLVAACILISSISAMANVNDDKSVVAKFKVTTNKADKMANLTFIPSTSEKVTVKILDENGKVIFQEQILNKDGFTRPYNLSQLNDAEIYRKILIRCTPKFLCLPCRHNRYERSAFKFFCLTGSKTSFPYFV